MSNIRIQIDDLSKISMALVQNKIPVIKTIDMKNDTDLDNTPN